MSDGDNVLVNEEELVHEDNFGRLRNESRIGILQAPRMLLFCSRIKERYP